MKKIVASVGLVALGASAVQSAYGQDITAAPAKPWSVSANLRGFYDDNVNTAPDGSPKTSTFGFNISPSLGVNWLHEQTSVKLDYTYSLLYYFKKPQGNTTHYDQDHTFDGELDHSFSERYRLRIADSFVLGQEPDVIAGRGPLTAVERVPGDNIRNYGSVTFDAQLTRLLGLELGYQNSFFDYHANIHNDGGNIPSPSGALDRIENTAHVDTRWQVMPETVAVLGYQYSQTDYTGNEQIDFFSPNLVSRDRNYRAHYVYVGADHNFSPDLTGSVRAGGRYTDYYNAGSHSLSPYAMASLSYNYAPESYVKAGFTYDRNATDMVNPDANGNLTLDEESASIFGVLHHRIVPNLSGELTAQYQNSTFDKGFFNGKSDRYLLLGLNLEYRFNPYLAAEAGYNYDKFDSDIADRSYDRNRVYIGLMASY